MKAYVLHGKKDLKLENRPDPRLGPFDVLVDVKRVGICGSDIHYYLDYQIGEFVPQKPIVLGHEFSGEVVEVGPKVKTFAVGDRVTAEPSIECRRCRYCRAGRYNLCVNLKFIGTAATIPHIDGAFAEQLAVPEGHCYRLDERLAYGAGALVEPLAVGAYAVLRAGVIAGSRILITGGGTIGQMVLTMVQVLGATDITVADINPFARKYSLEHGGVDAFNPQDASMTEEHMSKGFDVIFEASGSPSALSLAYAVASRGARIVQIGTQPKELTLPANLVTSKELTVIGSFRYAHVFSLVLDLIATGRIDVSDLISTVYPYSNVKDAFERAVTKQGIVKVQVSREK